MNIRIVRKKIKSVSNVKKITNAMQLVAAVKMKKSQQQALEGEPYRIFLKKIIQKITSKIDNDVSTLIKVKNSSIDRDLIILFSSNKGLCGAFNFNLFRFLIKRFNISKCDFITVGKKGAEFLSKVGGKILADFSKNSIDSISAIFQTAFNLYVEGKYKSVKLIYNKFISTLHHEITEEVILPVPKQIDTSLEKTTLKLKGDYIIEPSANILVETLLKSFIEEKIRGALYNSEAAEHSSRMIAMKNATENAQEVIYNLILQRNKLRQEKITYELLDMTTAKESVEKS